MTSPGRQHAAVGRAAPAAGIRRLLAWYRHHRRELPWRASRDPYRVWVSEIMLQQTRVETVVPFYVRFLERFPTVAALAAAEEQEVLALWSGLGYYRRARYLHRAARRVAAAGAMPTSAAQLAALPGIGPSTAAAIASISFGEAEPVLDGNVQRVAARLRRVGLAPGSAAGRRRLVAIARRYLDPAAPGDSNQALMELGATICLPREPRCERCPLANDCRAAAAGDPERFPKRRPAAVTRPVAGLAVIVEAGGCLLLFRRPPGAGVLAGLWEVPWVEVGDPGRAPAALAARYGGRWRVGRGRGSIRHAITNLRLKVEVRAGSWRSRGTVEEVPEAGWFSRAEIGGLAVSALLRKSVACFDGAGG